MEEGGTIGFWTGSINNVWDAATTANWSSNGPGAPLASVTFDVATEDDPTGSICRHLPG